jgi:hypothetical protein
VGIFPPEAPFTLGVESLTSFYYMQAKQIGKRQKSKHFKDSNDVYDFTNSRMLNLHLKEHTRFHDTLIREQFLVSPEWSVVN